MHRLWAIGVLLAVLAMLFLASLEIGSILSEGDDVFAGEYTSEQMMQTVSIRDLREQPLLSLGNIHIQPPGLDFMRAVFARLWNAGGRSDEELLRLVDGSLYVLWIVVYGLMGLTLYLWFSELTSPWFGVAVTVAFLIHPACISYATFLETTFLTATLVLVLSYLLWRLKEHEHVPLALLLLTPLLLFLTRSLFDWPFVLVLACSLVLMRVPFRTIALCIGIVGTIMGLYTAKQAYQFGLTNTSSFVGYNLVRSIGLGVDYADMIDHIPEHHSADERRPAVLTRERKLDGSVNFNNERFLIADRVLRDEYFRKLRTMSLSDLAETYGENLRLYLTPSTRPTSLGMVGRLPWLTWYDVMFSAPVFPLLVAAAFLVWLASARRSDFLACLGFCLPLGFIVVASVLGEKGENMRFKFFVEPVLYVFVATQAYSGAAYLRSQWGSPLHTGRRNDP